MKPSCACELAERALENYRIIKRKEDDGEEAFATVAALSATLFCVIAYKEWGFLERVKQKELDNIINIERLPEPIRAAVNNQKDHSKESNFFDIITLIRHSLAHSNITLLVNTDNYLAGVRFKLRTPNIRGNDNIYKNNPELPHDIELSEKDLVSLLDCLVNVFYYCTEDQDTLNIEILNKKDTAS